MRRNRDQIDQEKGRAHPGQVLQMLEVWAGARDHCWEDPDKMVEAEEWKEQLQSCLIVEC